PKAKADAKNVGIGVPFLRRGETIPIRVMAFRRDGFDGEIELTLNQPPPGLIFEGDRLKSGKSSDFIYLTAAEDAPGWIGPLHLLGQAKTASGPLRHEARGAAQLHAVNTTDSERVRSRMTREFDLGISDQESAPVSVAAVETKVWEANPTSKLQIPLK